MKTAILVDGAFYRKKSQDIIGYVTPALRATELEDYCRKHLSYKKYQSDYLYRVFYYDCCATDKKIFHPYLKKLLIIASPILLVG